MLVLLLPTAFLLLSLLAYQHIRERRLSILAGLTMTYGILVGMTEALSPFHAITRFNIALIWSCLVAVAGGLVLLRRRSCLLVLPDLRCPRLSYVE